MEPRSARLLIEQLGLEPHPEGGWYREHFRSTRRLSTPRGPRAALTSIHFLLEAGQVSRWHVLNADEVWHFQAGEPLELFSYHPDTKTPAWTSPRSVTTGPDPSPGRWTSSEFRDLP